MVLELAHQFLLVFERLTQHDEVVELLDQIVAVGGDQHLHARIHESRQQPGQSYLVHGIEMTLRLVDDEQMVLPDDVSEVEVEVRQSARRRRSGVQGNVEAAASSARFGNEPDLVTRSSVVAIHHVLDVIVEFVPVKLALVPSPLRNAPGIVDVVLDRHGVPAGGSIDDKKWSGAFTVLVIGHLLQQIDELVFGKIEFPIEQRDAEAFGRQDERIRQHTGEQKLDVEVGYVPKAGARDFRTICVDGPVYDSSVVLYRKAGRFVRQSCRNGSVASADHFDRCIFELVRYAENVGHRLLREFVAQALKNCRPLSCDRFPAQRESGVSVTDEPLGH